jgi:starch synthase
MRGPLKILFIASEVAPFSKTGGLGDVSGALPAALAALGDELLVATPRYRAVRDPRLQPVSRELQLRFPFGAVQVGLRTLQAGPNHRVLFLEQPGLYDRESLYGYDDDHRRFGLLTAGALSGAQALGFIPDIVHLNDWQTGLTALALQRGGYRDTALGKASTVFTVHNLAYQGLFPRAAMADLGLPPSLFTPEAVEFYGHSPSSRPGCSTRTRSPPSLPPTRERSSPPREAAASTGCCATATARCEGS